MRTCRQRLVQDSMSLNSILYTQYTFLQFYDKDFQLQIKELYAEHCIGLDGPLRDHMATTYVLQCNSFLNKCLYFHVTDGLVPDVIHDVV